MHPTIDRILVKSGKTLDAGALPSEEQLAIAIGAFEVDPDALVGKTSEEVRAILFTKHEERQLPVRDGDVQRVLASTNGRKDENSPSEKQIRFALAIGLTPHDLMGKSRKEISVMGGEHAQSYKEEHRYQRILTNVAQVSKMPEDKLREICPNIKDLMRFIENRNSPDGILNMVSSMKQQKYPHGTVIHFIHGSTRKGQQEGKAEVLECKDTGYVVVKILSAKLFHCKEVAKQLNPGKVINLRPTNIKEVLSTPEETGAEEAA